MSPSLTRKELLMEDLKQIDKILSQPVDAKALPGVVAMAATDKGVVYEGAFGQRQVGKPAPMTLDTVVWIASMTKANRHGGHAARGAGQAEPGKSGRRGPVHARGS
jgi:CubicO group peptidase (beta-lactamase class C family)